MKKTKDMIVGVVDYGLFGPYVSERLAQDCKEVIFYCPRSSGFPLYDRDKIGDGIDGVTKVLEEEFYARKPEIDLFVFPFLGMAGMQTDLIAQGKDVFGCRNGDILERDRKFFKQMLLKIGLPIIPFEGKQQIMEVTGFDAIRSALQRYKDKWIKFSDLRGHGESRYHQDYETSENWLFEFAHNAGADRHDFTVQLEDNISTPGIVEIGGDLYFNGKKYLDLATFGMEQKDEAYSCMVMPPDDMPKLVRNVHSRFAQALEQFDVRSVVATEMRIPNKELAYFNDSTLRHPSPPSELMMGLWKNPLDMYTAIARGEDVKQEAEWKYAASLVINSSRVKHEVTTVTFPEKYKDRVRLQNYCIDRNGKYQCIPQDEGGILGAAVGYSNDSLEEAQAEALEVAESMKAESISYEEDAFDKMDEKIQKARKLGVWI